MTVAVENRSTAYDIDQFADQEKIQMTNSTKIIAIIIMVFPQKKKLILLSLKKLELFQNK